MAIGGNPKCALHGLYADHHGWLHGWLRGKLDDSGDAADLAQDTFLRLMASRRRPMLAGDRPRALLTHIAKGLLIDHWRRKRVERAYLDTLAHLPAAQVPPAEEQLIVIETLARIDAMLARLPALTREVFLLAQLDGLTLQQISDRAQVPVITVRRHIRKALLACMALD
ncbi:sigma-70 family RNA polymerase sigma factor [Paracoccus aminovorans]|uniref:sigma-70 family RNA polymerase sigma factor n=1 Tax=Paracoccus aminovorans TaxID=34004 RepID=UPI000943EC71|nr:sigma-70 family RNA polymerase sigma factor [Paracoccus aminovorans]CQR84423.1 ECF subfamily RNA polymerase sigma-24 factor [Paracoccus aminovorans]